MNANTTTRDIGIRKEKNMYQVSIIKYQCKTFTSLTSSIRKDNFFSHKSFAIITVVFKYLLLTGTSVKLITERHRLSSQVLWDEGLGGIDWSR